VDIAVPAEAIDALRGREPIFHRERRGADRGRFEALGLPEYWEVGATGRAYRREFVLDTVTQRALDVEDDPWLIHGFMDEPVAPSVWLATYELWQAACHSRRSTLWVRTADGWRARYHQGTLIEPS
jgi:hypothetical protein